jgi:hypothetical protein
MSSKAQCPICHKGFTPNRKVGNRQRVCSGPDCQKEARRRATAKWRRRTAPGRKRKRLAMRILKLVTAEGVTWPSTQDGLSLKFTSFLAEVVRLVLTRMRETSAAQPHRNKGVRPKSESLDRARNECRAVV